MERKSKHRKKTFVENVQGTLDAIERQTTRSSKAVKGTLDAIERQTIEGTKVMKETLDYVVREITKSIDLTREFIDEFFASGDFKRDNLGRIVTSLGRHIYNNRNTILTLLEKLEHSQIITTLTYNKLSSIVILIGNLIDSLNNTQQTAHNKIILKNSFSLIRSKRYSEIDFEHWCASVAVISSKLVLHTKFRLGLPMEEECDSLLELAEEKEIYTAEELEGLKMFLAQRDSILGGSRSAPEDPDNVGWALAFLDVLSDESIEFRY